MRLLAVIEYSNGYGVKCLNPYSTGNEVVGWVQCTKPTGETYGLNPYSTGNEVVGPLQKSIKPTLKCLNPYSTGNEVVGVS